MVWNNFVIIPRTSEWFEITKPRTSEWFEINNPELVNGLK